MITKADDIDCCSAIDAIKKLRSAMREISAGSQRLSRGQIVAALDATADALKPFETLLVEEDGLQVFEADPGIEMLKRIKGAILDLDSGKTHGALRSVSDGPNASLTSEQRDDERFLLELVAIIRRHRHYRTWAEAERAAALVLNEMGQTWRGKPVTAGGLKNLRDNQGKRKLRPAPRRK